MVRTIKHQYKKPMNCKGIRNILTSKSNWYLPGILLLFLMLPIHAENQQTNPIAKNGILDLREWDFDKSSSVNLRGEWDFYWKQFFSDGKNLLNPIPIKIPGTWNNLNVAGNPIGADGFATLHLRILLHPEKTKDQILSIRTRGNLTASRMIINGQIFPGSGILGKTMDSSIPGTLPQIAVFSTGGKNELNLFLEISNFHHRKGGVLYDLQIGREEYMIQSLEKKRSIDIFISGLLFIMGLYHAGLFFIRKKDFTSLLFSIFCLTIYMRTAVVDEKIFSIFLPDLPYRIYVSIEYITYFLTVPLAIHFLYRILDFQRNFWVIQVFYGLTTIFVLIVLTTNSRFFSNLIPPFLPIMSAGIFIGVLYLGIAIYRKKKFAYLMMLGCIFIVGTAINDTLNTTEVIHTGYLLHYGLMILVFMQAIVLAAKFSTAFIEVENLSKELKVSQSHLEMRVANRTAELKEAKDIAVDANKLKDKFISLVSHDLRSPISGVCSLLDILSSDPSLDDETRTDYLESSRKTLLQSLEMISELLDISRIKSGKILPEYKVTDVSDLADQAIRKLRGLIKRKNLSAINSIPPNTTIECDPFLISEVISNLLTNSIKFSKDKNQIRISSISESLTLSISVTDNGVGIDPEMMGLLFDPDVKTTTRGTHGEKGMGLGLPLCRDIIRSHGGFFSVRSEPNLETKFTFTIPYEKISDQEYQEADFII